MRAVNLLPERDRPKAAPTMPGGVAYGVIGVLALAVLAALVLVLTSNGIARDKQEIAKAKQKQTAADARAAKLGAFGQFSQVRKTREASITSLAQTRFDWERFLRELALVLPNGTFLTEVNGVTSGDPSSTSTDGASSGASADPNAATTPGVKLSGCATSQSKVAETMVRLRNLDRAEDVSLDQSAAADTSESGGSSASSGAASGGTDGGCGDRYAFDATVTFSAQPTDTGAQKKVPTTLGGGS